MLKKILAAVAVLAVSACASMPSNAAVAGNDFGRSQFRVGFTVADDSAREREAELQRQAAIAWANREPTEAENVQIDCLARNIYFEARGESLEGQEAVGHVTLNRRASGLFPNTVCGVVYEHTSRGCQFTWTCDGHSDRIRQRETFNQIKELAKRMFLNTPPDNTNGALYYHANYVNPRWRNVSQSARIGAHIFYSPA